MALVLRRRISRAKDFIVWQTIKPQEHYALFFRTYSDDNSIHPDLGNNTILVENGFNVQELPVVIRKLKDITNVKDVDPAEPVTTDSVNYSLIHAEFKQCVDLRDVFSLLSKCTKITPNIALGAMERIHDIEKEPNALLDVKSNHIHMAKGAILDKLLKVIMKTEDTQTILNVLKSISTFMEPYKHKFCDELLFRTIDNKLTVEQLCDFSSFLIENRSNSKYSETIDKLWVGFVEKEGDINEKNIAAVFRILPGLRVSKRIILSLLEQKLTDLWRKVTIPVMQDILAAFVEEKYMSMQAFATVGRWLYTNIHAIDEDSFLDILSKITRLKYTDDQIEKAIEKYMKLKGNRIQSHVFVVGVLNHCMQFQICNQNIMKSCSEYFVNNASNVPPSFLKSYIYPFGFLNFQPDHSGFWEIARTVLLDNLPKINIDDISFIILSHIYLGIYPHDLVSNVFSSGNLNKTNSPDVWRMLHLIDTAMSLECPNYTGPFIPKDQWSQPVAQDKRIKNIVSKIRKTFEEIAGRSDKLSTEVMVPHFSDQIYMIDVMLHPPGLGGSTYNWKAKSSRNANVAFLIHLPDHYCSDSEHLIGPQVMRKKHLRILGLKVVSVKYTLISQFYTSYNTKDLKKYLMDSIKNAEECL